MVQTKAKWSEKTLEDIFTEVYTLEMDKQLKQDFIPLMYGVENSEKDRESYEGVGAVGLMREWGKTNNQVFYEDVEELWEKVIRNRKFSLGAEIDRDWLDDLRISKIKDRVTDVAVSAYRTSQLQAVEFLNNGFAATGANYIGEVESFVGPDGQPLFSTAHPLSPTNTTDVQSNMGTSELTIDAFDATAVAMQEWVDDRGLQMPVMPDTLIVSPYNARAAFKIAGLPEKDLPAWEPNSNQFNPNIYNGIIKVIVNPFLSKSAATRKNWFVADSKRMQRMNKWQWRRRPSSGKIEDFNKEIFEYKVVGRWGYGFTNYSFIYGQKPTV